MFIKYYAWNFKSLLKIVSPNSFFILSYILNIHNDNIQLKILIFVTITVTFFYSTKEARHKSYAYAYSVNYLGIASY